MEVIKLRRSIRSFEDRRVPGDMVEELLRAAMQAPSAKNQQPWRFMVLEDRELLDKLAEGLTYGKMLAQAPLALLMLADTRDLASPDRWPQDLAAATQNVLLQATALGLASVWVSLYPDDGREGHVKGYLDLEDHLVPFCLVALGYSERKPHFIDRYDEDKVIKK